MQGNVFEMYITPKSPNRQSANMAQKVSKLMYFKIGMVYKIPPGGGNKPISG